MTDPHRDHDDNDIWPLGPPLAQPMYQAHAMGVPSDRVPDIHTAIAYLRADLLAERDPEAGDLALGAILSTTDVPLLLPIVAGLAKVFGAAALGGAQALDEQLANMQAGHGIQWRPEARPPGAG
jgi:hypothetical protein